MQPLRAPFLPLPPWLSLISLSSLESIRSSTQPGGTVVDTVVTLHSWFPYQELWFPRLQLTCTEPRSLFFFDGSLAIPEVPLDHPLPGGRGLQQD